MLNFLRCLLRSCFGEKDDDDERDDHQHPHSTTMIPYQHRRSARSLFFGLSPSLAARDPLTSSSRSRRGGYQATRTMDDTEVVPQQQQQQQQQPPPPPLLSQHLSRPVPSEEDCCDSSGTSDTTQISLTTTSLSSHPNSHKNNVLHEFWTRLRERLAKFELDHSMGDVDGQVASTTLLSNDRPPENRSNHHHHQHHHNSNKKKSTPKKAASAQHIPILRTARTFDATFAIPTILAEEVVLPGSPLQAAMAVAAAHTLQQDGEHEMGDECVICMEPFASTNPRMPTLCGCGENKTFFHLPCLYQWMEQNKNCPTCRQRLQWEEFY
jgi:hypothetical protein